MHHVAYQSLPPGVSVTIIIACGCGESVSLATFAAQKVTKVVWFGLVWDTEREHQSFVPQDHLSNNVVAEELLHSGEEETKAALY